jgi:hypothetical protein
VESACAHRDGADANLEEPIELAPPRAGIPRIDTKWVQDDSFDWIRVAHRHEVLAQVCNANM